MKYCTHCGKELLDEAAICPGCGCATGSSAVNGGTPGAMPGVADPRLLEQLSQKLKTNAIIWIVIGALQILAGLLIEWWVLIVGVLNIVSAISDINYSKEILTKPSGIVAKFEPMGGAIVTLVYNLLIGGVIGVIGSIYYFVAIRSFVMENKASFAIYDDTNS